MTRLDIHTNLGTFPGSASAISNTHICSVDELEAHIRKFNLTHHLCLYGRDEYHLLKELADRLPEVTHYGVQCAFGLDDKNATDLDAFEPDICKGLPHVIGIKLHSVRGWWQRKVTIEEEHQDITGKKTGLYRKLTSVKADAGLDYGDFRFMRKLLDKLPKSALISLHTQGSLNIRNKGTPLHIGHLASKYPALKFIINHSGDYGVQSFKPSFLLKHKPGVNGGFADYMLLHSQSKQAIASAAYLAKDFYNIYLDSSNYCDHKALVYNDTNTVKWALGTDIPFGSDAVQNFDKEEQKFINKGIICDYDRAVRWLDNSIEDVMLEYANEHNMQTIKRTKKVKYRKAIPEEQRVGNPESKKDYSDKLPDVE